MDAKTAKAIADQWMIPTPSGAYMAGLENRPIIERAEGIEVIDTTGKRYLDFGSGQMAAALGHNHPRYVEAVKRSLETISHSSKTFLNVDRLELHRRLGEILTPPLQKTLFLVSGSDAIEAAIDLARKATGGVDVLALDMALHGSTSFVTRSLTFGWGRSKHGLAAPGTSAILTPYAYRSPLAGGNDFVEKCLQTSFEIADANFTAKPAAVILEPVLSAGGIIVPPPGYVKALAKMAHDRGMLLIMDESQTGLGKTGKMWGHLHEDVVPDIMTVSKHFGAGLPVSAVCTTAAIADQAVGNGYFANIVFQNPAWDYRTFNFDSDMAYADMTAGVLGNSTDPDMSAAKRRGVKIIQYHGWNDQTLQPAYSPQWYQTVARTMGGLRETQEFYRLFMVPGMTHCYFGPGASSFGGVGQQIPPVRDATHDVQTALESWVEKGVAPERIVATKYTDDKAATRTVRLTRPLCVHPAVAQYSGAGDTNDAASFVCRGGVPAGHDDDDRDQ